MAADEYPSITCPICKMTSYHPKDIEYQYCGNCHNFHDLMLEKITSERLKNEAVDLIAEGQGHGLNPREILGEALKRVRVESGES